MKAFKADTLQKDERYTLKPTIDICKPFVGLSIDDEYTMDVAACDASHWAPLYYTKERSGLEVPWYGHVWCNPPYTNIGAWVLKAVAMVERKQAGTLEAPLHSISMLLPSNRTDLGWWQGYIEPYRDCGGPLETYFLKRQRFGYPGNPEGKPVKVDGKTKYGGSNFGSVLLVWQ